MAAAVEVPVPETLIRVLVGGDVIPHRPQLVDPASIGAALAPLAELFRSADAAIVNYETATFVPLRGVGAAPNLDRGPLSMAATPAWMRAVLSANVTGLTLANNHA
jgi:hypothetical protein